MAAGDHAAILWPLLCGMAKAKYYLMTGDFIDGPEAERIGLVTKCLPDEDVMGEALAIAERLAQASRTAVQWTKRALNQWMISNASVFGESLALEMLGFLGPDAVEGLAAVKERREPEFPSARSATQEWDRRAPVAAIGRGAAAGHPRGPLGPRIGLRTP